MLVNCVFQLSRRNPVRAALVAIAGAAALFVGAPSTSAADLSPEHWPAAVRARAEARDYAFYPARAASVKARSALVTTTSAVGAHVGMETLRQGGTAADAAAAIALTEVATRLGSVTSYAGVLKLVYFEAETGKVHSLRAWWSPYAGETDPASIPTGLGFDPGGRPPGASPGGALGRQTLVPGFMAGIEALHDRFGRLPLADLFQPAIWYAENGVVLSPALGAYFQQRQLQLWRTAAGRRFASMPDGTLPKTGDRFRQPELALTLRAVAKQGAGYMYTGDWARAYVEAVNAEGGKATLADLAAYRAEWNEPVSLPFAGTTLYGVGEGPEGSCQMLTALNLLSALQIQEMGLPWLDPKAFVTYLDALRFVQYGLPTPEVNAWERSQGFSPDCRGRLTSEYAAVVAPQLRPALQMIPAAPAPASGHSEAVIVVDRWGNVAALVHSINTTVWGGSGIVVGGVPISDAAPTYRDQLAGAKPGEHLRHRGGPIIALRDSKPVLTVVAIGQTGLIPETVRLVSGVLAQKADLRALMDAPPLLADSDPAGGAVSAWGETLPAGAYDAKLREEIETLGVRLKEAPFRKTQALRGTAVAVVIDQPSGTPSAVEARAVLGFAEGDQ